MPSLNTHIAHICNTKAERAAIRRVNIAYLLMSAAMLAAITVDVMRWYPL